MKLFENKAFLELKDAVEAGLGTEGYLWKAKSIKSKSFSFIDDPDDLRKVLIEYDSLKDKQKNQVGQWLKSKIGCTHPVETPCNCGNPYEYLSKAPIRNLLVQDSKAEAFYLNFRYNGPTGNDNLPIETIRKYSLAAGIMNVVLDGEKDKKANIKARFGIDLGVFYDIIGELIIEFKALGKLTQDFPASYVKLRKRIVQYKADGYSSLIDKRFGNKSAAKISDEQSESLLLEMISHHNQHDDIYICNQYNKWAVENNYKMIDVATVGVWRRKRDFEIAQSRNGNAEWYNKYGKEVKGFRPTQPLYLVESDDNHLDLLFLDVEDTTQGKYYHRYKAIVVTDSFNDYVLGYAYAENLTWEVVRAAYVNAMYHIRFLTDGWHLPHEVKTDRWAIETLRPFYQGMGKYYDTPVGSKRRGYIEQFFGSAHWKRCIKAGANNYTGNNVTAANRGVNIEALKANAKDRPTLQYDSILQIENFFNRLRFEPTASGKSKHQEWLEAWFNMPEDKKRPITDEQFLLKFGIRHTPKNGERNRITNGGVEPTIKGIEYNYVVPPAYYLPNVGKKVDILYDPNDMSRVLVTDFESLRFIGRSAKLQPRAMADYAPGDRTFLNALLDEKRDDVKTVANRSSRRKEVLQDAGIDAETVLQAGIMIKEIKQAAEQRLIEHPQPSKRNADPYSQF